MSRLRDLQVDIVVLPRRRLKYSKHQLAVIKLLKDRTISPGKSVAYQKMFQLLLRQTLKIFQCIACVAKVLLHVNFNIEKFHRLKCTAFTITNEAVGSFCQTDFNSSKQAFPKMV